VIMATKKKLGLKPAPPTVYLLRRCDGSAAAIYSDIKTAKMARTLMEVTFNTTVLIIKYVAEDVIA